MRRAVAAIVAAAALAAPAVAQARIPRNYVPSFYWVHDAQHFHCFQSRFVPIPGGHGDVTPFDICGLRRG